MRIFNHLNFRSTMNICKIFLRVCLTYVWHSMKGLKDSLKSPAKPNRNENTLDFYCNLTLALTVPRKLIRKKWNKNLQKTRLVLDFLEKNQHIFRNRKMIKGVMSYLELPSFHWSPCLLRTPYGSLRIFVDNEKKRNTIPQAHPYCKFTKLVSLGHQSTLIFTIFFLNLS